MTVQFSKLSKEDPNTEHRGGQVKRLKSSFNDSPKYKKPGNKAGGVIQEQNIKCKPASHNVTRQAANIGKTRRGARPTHGE